MSQGSPECAHARLQIGGDPHHLPAEVVAHLAICAECTRFRDETMLLDGRLRAALELPLAQFRTRKTAPVRRHALAASILLGIVLAGGIWGLRSQPTLANDVVLHVLDEAGSWDQKELLPASAVAETLRTAGIHLDASLPVIYAYPCPFRGHRVAHLVVRTENGPMTVMLLVHENVSKRTQFSENGLHGVILPAHTGSVAILARQGEEVPEAFVGKVVSAVR